MRQRILGSHGLAYAPVSVPPEGGGGYKKNRVKIFPDPKT